MLGPDPHLTLVGAGAMLIAWAISGLFVLGITALMAAALRRGGPSK